MNQTSSEKITLKVIELYEELMNLKCENTRLKELVSKLDTQNKDLSMQNASLKKQLKTAKKL